MKQKDFNKLRQYLDRVDDFGATIGSKVGFFGILSLRAIWFVVALICAGLVVLLFSIFNGLRSSAGKGE